MNPFVFPYEYFLAQVCFGLKVSELTEKSIDNSYIYYTNLYSSVTGIDWRDNPFSPVWSELIKKVEGEKNAEKIATIFFDTYRSLPHSKYNAESIPEGMVAFGPLVVDYTPYNRQRETIRIHFLPRREEKSWLATERFPELQEACKQLFIYAKENYNMRYVTISTWLLNIPNFRKLFPQSALAREKDIGMSTFLGVWQEFLKADGFGNRDRLDEFLKKLAGAQNMNEAINAIPLKVLESISPIEEFYAMYAI